jgi:PAS domain S-box-containing protein
MNDLILNQLQTVVPILNSLNLPVIVCDSTGIVTQWNNASKDLFGFSETEVIGKHVFKVSKTLEQADLKMGVLQKLQNGEIWKGELEFRKKDSSHFLGELTCSPIFDDKNLFIGISGVVFDLTHQKAIEEGLHESEKKYHDLFYLMHDGLVLHEMIFDSKGMPYDYIYLDLNPAYERLTGIKRSDSLGRTVKSVFPNTEQYWIDFFGSVVKAQEPSRFESFAGEIGKYFRVFAFPTGGNNFAVFVEDISEQKQLFHQLVESKERAEQASKAKSSFLANMSHELRTPLIGIIGFSEILSETTESEDDLNMLESIRKSGQHLKTTLDQILDLARIESNSLEIKSDKVNLVTVIKEAIKNYELSAKQKGLIINFEPDTPHFVIVTDQQYLYLIICNLIGNGIKYTSKGTVSITLSKELTEEGEMVLISVIDTGIGISKEYQSIIFEEFRQVSEGYGRLFEGTGLGLSITRKLVYRLNGTIGVESTIGAGSKFIVKLPAIYPAYEESNEFYTLPFNPLDDEEKLKINEVKLLVIDDDEMSSAITGKILSSLAETVVTNKVYTGLQLLKDDIFNVVLVNVSVKMPGSVISLIVEIKSIATSRNIPVIAFAPFSMEGETDFFVKSGFDDYISKPFLRHELLKKVKKFLI